MLKYVKKKLVHCDKYSINVCINENYMEIFLLEENYEETFYS